jgi:hypothetical protein
MITKTLLNKGFVAFNAARCVFQLVPKAISTFFQLLQSIELLSVGLLRCIDGLFRPIF